jgi:MFS family permease
MNTAANTALTSSFKLGGARSWVVIICASLFFFYEFVQMNMFNTINADLMRAFNINGKQISELSAFYFYADVICLFPAGIILDYFSTRKLIALALSLCTAATIGLSFAHSYAFAATMRTLSGIGAAFCFLSAMRLATRWFPPKHLAVATGFIVTMAMIGGMVAQTPLAYFNIHFGWRHTVLFDGLMGVVFVVVILLVVRDFPPGSIQQKEANELLHNNGFWNNIFAAWKNPQNWLCGLYTSFLNLPILIIGALWGSQYLIQVHHMYPEQAATINMMLFVGTIFGSPILGWISDTIGKRKLPMIVCAIISIGLVLAIMFLPSPSFIVLFLLFLLLGFFTSAQIISYPVIAESNQNALVGTATGWAAVLIMGGGAFGQPLFGWLLNIGWSGLKQDGVAVYSLADYHFAWMIFPIMFVIALIIALFIRETHCKPLPELNAK